LTQKNKPVKASGVSGCQKPVRQELDAFVGEAPQFDDITMLGFRYLGPKADS